MQEPVFSTVLPVVIDICGVPCGQIEVHQEAGRCRVKEVAVVGCKFGSEAYLSHTHTRTQVDC